MSEDTKPTANAEKATTKTATVRVLKTGMKYGNFTCAKGHVITSMDLDEVKLRTDAGEIELIRVNP